REAPARCGEGVGVRSQERDVAPAAKVRRRLRRAGCRPDAETMGAPAHRTRSAGPLEHLEPRDQPHPAHG
ncbi:MAG: hypothetical protein ACK55I_17320, partial [bacterium]